MIVRAWPPVVFCLLLALAGGSAAAIAAAQEPETLPLDMSVWDRRDYARCAGYGLVTSNATSLTIEVENSALKYWQIPTLAGPLPINQDWTWVKRCERPPGKFATAARKQAEADGIATMVDDYPCVTWRWRVDSTIDGSRTADSGGDNTGAAVSASYADIVLHRTAPQGARDR